MSSNLNRILIQDITDNNSNNNNNNRLANEFSSTISLNNINSNNNNRQLLPAIRFNTPLASSSNTSPTNFLPIANLNPNSNSLELNNAQFRLKQLESRLQLTNNNNINGNENKFLLEEILKVQNEMFSTLKKSLDTLNEERMARNILENNYKIQTENFIQLNARLKRTEEFLQEDRGAMQSLILYTKSLEQTTLNTQKDLFVKRDYQSQRLDELKIQIDDIQRSKDNLERSAYSLIEEIKNLKNKVDLESMSFGSLSSDLRNKTRRLEEENRQHFDQMKKHQDIMSNSENNLYFIKTNLENKINDLRDLVHDLKFKIEHEKEEKKSLEQSITTRYVEFNGLLNEEKQKYTECIRSIESLKRQINQNFENEKIKVNGLISETKDFISLSSNDKIEKMKDELLSKMRDLEKLVNDESDHKTKFIKNLKDTSEIKLESLKRYLDDEIKLSKDELKETNTKTLDSIKILNDGLNLIEKQNEERNRKFEKVISAEIKLRKTNEQSFNEKLDNHSDKLTYAIQSFQSSVGNLTNSISEQKEQFINRSEFDAFKKKQETLQSQLVQTEIQINTLKTNVNNHESIHVQQQEKVKELSETVFKIDSIQIPSINTKLTQTVSQDDLKEIKTSIDNLKEDSIQLNRELDSEKAKLKQELENGLEKLKAESNQYNKNQDIKLEKLETKTNEKLEDLNNSIGVWKKNINGVLDKVRLEQEETNRKINRIDEKFDDLKEDKNKT